MRNRRGEIATILTIATLVIIGVTAVVSSLNLNKKQSTSSRAAMACPDDFQTCGPATNNDCCDPSTEKCSGGQCVPLSANDCVGPTTCTGNSNKYYTKSGIYYTDKCISKKIDLSVYCAPPTALCDGPKKCNTSNNQYWIKSGAFYPSAGCALGTATSLTTVCPPSTGGVSCYFSNKASCEASHSSDKPGCINEGCSGTTYKYVATGGGTYACNGKGGNPMVVDIDNVTCENACDAKGSVYIKNSQGDFNGKHYCCCTDSLPTPGPNGEPNDSCCLLQCPADGAPKSDLYSNSLSQYSMPLTSCDGDPAYGKGWLYLCSKESEFVCKGGTLGPVETPAPVNNPPEADCEPTDSLAKCKGDLPRGVTGNNNSKWCCKASGPPIGGTTDICKDGNNFNCAEKSGVCGITGGNDTKSYYYVTNPVMTYAAIEGLFCKTKSVADVKTWCECGKNNTVPIINQNCQATIHFDGKETCNQASEFKYLNDVDGTQMCCKSMCPTCHTAPPTPIPTSQQSGSTYDYVNCTKQYDCRQSSDKNKAVCQDAGALAPYVDCANMCSPQVCYMNGFTSEPYLYCCAGRYSR